jgi:uncharacterized membrane protein
MLACLVSLWLSSHSLAQDSAVPAAVATAAGEAKIARGLLLENEGRVFFAPCRDRSYLNVSDGSPDGEVLRALHDFGLAPGSNLYVELLAVQEGGRLRVQALNFARTSARCLGEVNNDEQWRALGLEGQWAAVAGAGVLLLEQSGRTELRTAYRAIEEGKDEFSIPAELAVLHLRRGLCRLKDGSTLSGWQAELKTAAGERLEGCGWER